MSPEIGVADWEKRALDALERETDLLEERRDLWTQIDRLGLKVQDLESQNAALRGRVADYKAGLKRDAKVAAQAQALDAARVGTERLNAQIAGLEKGEAAGRQSVEFVEHIERALGIGAPEPFGLFSIEKRRDRCVSVARELWALFMAERDAHRAVEKSSAALGRVVSAVKSVESKGF